MKYFVNIHFNANRALPKKLMKYKHEILLHKQTPSKSIKFLTQIMVTSMFIKTITTRLKQNYHGQIVNFKPQNAPKEPETLT